MIKCAILDIDGVLLFTDPSKTEIDDNIGRSLFPTFANDLDLGKVPFQKFVDEYNKLSGKKFSAEEFLNILHNATKFNQELIDYLQSKNMKLGILSDNYIENVKEIRKRYRTKEWVSFEVYSCYEKVCKPDKKIFDLAIKKSGFKAEECLFIDDKQKNVEGAIKAGLHGILYTNLEEIKKMIWE